MKLYVVQNPNGEFFRPRGMYGYKEQWQKNLDDAKFYTRLGVAKKQCSFWANAYPKLGCPHVLEFDLDPAKAVVLDMVQYSAEAAQRKAKKVLKEESDRRAYNAMQDMTKAKKLIATFTSEQKRELGL